MFTKLKSLNVLNSKKGLAFLGINLALGLIFLSFQNCADFSSGADFSSKRPIEEVIPHCKDITAQNFNPKLTHNFDSFSKYPDYKQVMSSPVVGDINGDGYPEIGFVTFKGSAYSAEGVLRVIDGFSKKEILSIGSSLAPFGSAAPLFIDIDGDGKGEIVYPSADMKSVIALNYNGKLRWQHTLMVGYNCRTGLSAADINNDGKADIIAQKEVIFEQKLQDGRYSTFAEAYKSSTAGCSHFATNLNASDSGLPIVSSQGVHEFKNGKFQDRFLVNNLLCGNYCTVAAADVNPQYPGKELIYTGHGAFRIYSSTGQIIADKNLTEHYPADQCTRTDGNGNPYQIVGGGVATVGNFDSNPNTMEIGIATGKSLTIFDWQGNKIAGSRTNDCSSLVTSVTSFDFNGDGIPEILYGDEDYFRVYTIIPGQADLKVIWEVVNTSGTLYEYPVVADLNRDWSPEIIMVSNNYAGRHQENGTNGLRIFSASETEGMWMPTRDIWNQHNYFISNVTDHLTATSSTGYSDAISKNFRRNLPGQELECIPE